MVYLRARYYNAANGRFQSRDTWGGSDNSPQSLNRWNYTQSNPINYTDPSGNYCIAGFDIGPWGSKCTQEERLEAVHRLENLQGFLVSSENFQLGFVYEIMDSMVVLGPETQGAVWEILKHTKVGENIENTTALGTVLASLFCNVNALKNNQIVKTINNSIMTIRGDPFFMKGRAMGRIAAGLMAGGIIAAGILSSVSSKPAEILLAFAGPGTGGGTWVVAGAIVAVNAGVIAYGGAISLGLIAKESQDHLIERLFASGSGGGGGGGGGGEGGGWGRHFTPEQAEVIRLAKAAKARRGISMEEAQSLLDEARSVGLKTRGPETHIARPFDKLHIHIGTINHIIVIP